MFKDLDFESIEQSYSFRYKLQRLFLTLWNEYKNN